MKISKELQTGKKWISPACLPAYEQLKLLAGNGCDEAKITISCIRALTSGRLPESSILVHKNLNTNHKNDVYSLYLPSCKVTTEKQPNHKHQIIDLKLETDIQKSEDKTHTGLYLAYKKEDKWFAGDADKKSLITPERKVIVISDGGYRNAQTAVENLAGIIRRHPQSRGVFFDEFHIHFTEHCSKYGGLINYTNAINPISNSKVNKSAIRLAKTMYDTKDVPQIEWASMFGGSAVLTQALSILASQNIQLPRHTIYLFRPSTNVKYAVSAAEKIGLLLEWNYIKTEIFDFIGNISRIGAMR